MELPATSYILYETACFVQDVFQVQVSSCYFYIFSTKCLYFQNLVLMLGDLMDVKFALILILSLFFR